MIEIFIFLFVLLVGIQGITAFMIYNIEMYLEDLVISFEEFLENTVSFEELLKNKENNDE